MTLAFAAEDETAIPLVLLDEDALPLWLADQDARSPAWVAAHDFKARLGSALTIPDGAGGIALALAGMGTAKSRARDRFPLAAGAATVNWIVPTAEGAGNGTEVADFAVQFGVDTSPVDTPADFGCGVATAAGRSRDCIADSYVAALPAGVTSNQIKAVRVCLVLRSEASDGSVVKPKGVPKCAEVLAGTADAADAEVISSSQTDRKLYRTFVTTVLMKNLKDN